VAVGPTELHTIARRYLLERHAEWTRRYDEMGQPKGGQYSAESAGSPFTQQAWPDWADYVWTTPFF
jgi:hypothetical protein